MSRKFRTRKNFGGVLVFVPERPADPFMLPPEGVEFIVDLPAVEAALLRSVSVDEVPIPIVEQDTPPAIVECEAPPAPSRSNKGRRKQ